MTLNRYLFLAVALAELAYGFASASPSEGGVWFHGTGEVAYQLGPIAVRGEAGWRAVR